MPWVDLADSACPIANALAVVGDRWTLLIMRELSMGVHRFDDLSAQTEMSSHLLSSRLKRMEDDGIVERRLYCAHPPRYEYHATERGAALAEVLKSLATWGRAWCAKGDGLPAVKRVPAPSDQGARDATHLDQRYFVGDVELQLSDAFWAERKARAETFAASPKGDKRRPKSTDRE